MTEGDCNSASDTERVRNVLIDFKAVWPAFGKPGTLGLLLPKTARGAG